jgi:hypothetical protein
MALEAQTIALSGMIVAFAGAASTAQHLMSTGNDAMTIKEFKFKINLTTDLDVSSETDISCKVWNVSVAEKLKVDWKEHMGLEVECTLAPTWSIPANSNGYGGKQ